MQEVTTYTAKRDVLGRFKPSKKKLVKYLFVAIALVNLYATVKMVPMIWNVRCEVNGQVVGGWFPTKQSCGDMAQAKQDSLELNRQQFVSINQDLFQ